MFTLIVLFTAAGAAQLICWAIIWVGYRRTDRTYTGQSDSTTLPISVVVAVKDGSNTVEALISALASQTYDAFEVVFVDDHSTDDTFARITKHIKEDARLRLESNPGVGKKHALSHGVERSTHDVLAFTDADCIPGSDWLAGIADLHKEHDDCIVVGYGPYLAEPGFLNRVVRFETVHTATLTIAAIGLNRPYMAVGRNLSYRKSTFKRLGGHADSINQIGGDDDLFVQNAHASGVEAHFLWGSNTFVFSAAPRTVQEWLQQKRRHLGVSRKYNSTVQASLSVYHLSALLCWIAPLVMGWAGIGILLTRLLPMQWVIHHASNRLNESGLNWSLTVLDLAFQCYLAAMVPLAWFRPARKW